MYEQDILRTLQRAVTTAVAGSTTPNLPVSYVQSGFPNGADEPDDQKWLELVWLPNNIQGDLWNGKNYRGILRMILHWPNNRTSPYGPLGLIGSIADYFYKGRLLDGSVQIYEDADLMGGALADKDDLLYPVSIRYMSYRKG